MRWKNNEEPWVIMNSTPYGPAYWTTLNGRVNRELCSRILDKLQSRLHGKQRQTFMENILEAFRVREDLIKCGKHAHYIKAVLREEFTPSIFDSWLI